MSHRVSVFEYLFREKLVISWVSQAGRPRNGCFCLKMYTLELLVFLFFVPWASMALWGCVQMSCHPELNQYIQDTLHCVKPLLEKVRGGLVLTDTPHPVCSSLSLG